MYARHVASGVIAEGVHPATIERAEAASRQRTAIGARMATECHGWGKRKAPPERGSTL